MTTKTTPAKNTSSPKKTNQNPEKKSTTNSKCNNQNSIAWIAMVIAVLSLLASLCIGWQSLRPTQNPTTVHALQENHQQLTQLQKQHTTLQQQQQGLHQSLASLTQQTQQILQQQPSTAKAWQLTRVNYLLHLAHDHLQFGQPLQTSLALLQAAQTILQKINDPSTIALQKALSANILTLEAITPLDYVVILSQINAIANHLHRLPLMGVPVEKNNMTTSTTSPKKQNWHTHWQQSLQSLRQLVIIRHHQPPVAPLITMDQQQYLIHNIQTQLNIASWALLNQQAEIFQQSLKQASTWIRQYYTHSAKATQTVLDQLQQLQKLNLQTKLPDLTPMLKLMEDLQQPQSMAKPDTSNS